MHAIAKLSVVECLLLANFEQQVGTAASQKGGRPKDWDSTIILTYYALCSQNWSAVYPELTKDKQCPRTNLEKNGVDENRLHVLHHSCGWSTSPVFLDTSR